MAKDAIFIQIFPSSILAFIFLCSITILADPKPPDPDIPIAIENGRNGNLGEWEYFVQQAYQISSQCYRVPEQNEVFSNRLHVRCKQELQADGASLLVCYPSVLDSDPDAFPDEDDEGLTPTLQPTMMESITVDPKSNITIECNELMEKCKRTPKCPMPKMAKKWGEKWHGFRVTRRPNGFQIELPFGNGDGNDTKINVPDLDDEWPQFFINFGKEKNLLTEIIRGSSSTPRKNKAKYKILDEKEQQKLETYLKARKWGIDLEYVKGLWMLALDILPVEEKQLFKKDNKSEIDESMIRWFTKSKPTIDTNEECVEKGEKLGIEIFNTTYYISAQYLTPSAADPKDDGFFRKQDLELKEMIELKENESRIEKIDHQILDGTTIRIRAQSTKGKFAIKLLIGFKRENEYLGERIFTIYVDLKENKPMNQCQVMDVNKNKTACNDQINPFMRVNDTGKPFWLQMEFKGGTEIHFNFDCTELIVPVEKIPYNPDAYIKFEGDLKLFKVENEKVLKIIKEGNELDDKFPTLTIRNLKDNLTDNNVLYFSGSTRNNAKIKIKFVQLDGDEQTENMRLIGIIEEDEICLKVDTYPNQTIDISVLLSRNDVNKLLLTFNGMHQTCEKNVYNFNYVQVSGDIQLMNDSPMFLPNLATKYKQSILTLPNSPYSYINFVLIIFDNEPPDVGDEKITIYLDCPSCEQQGEFNSLLTLIIDLEKKSLNVLYSNYTKFPSPYPSFWTTGEENKELPTNFTIGQPIWFTIKQEQRGETAANYKVIINGENLLDIDINVESKIKGPFVQAIHMEGNLFLFNEIISFPMPYRMKSDNSDKLPANLNISIKGIVMPNAKKLEFILFTPNFQEKPDSIEHLHVRVDQKNNEICINNKYIQDDSCKAPIHAKSPFVEGNIFSLVLSGKQWEKESLIVQINDKKFEVKGGNFSFDAMYLAIMGDMVLFNAPKCVPECPGQKIV